jgi:glycosyltransferase involved in cell wall biosynthesis
MKTAGPIRSVVFATTVFGHGANGPETYARYLWDGFGEDPDIEFHLVAPELPGPHPCWHPAGGSANSLDLYRRVAQTALHTARQLGAAGQQPILHVNNSNLHSSLLAYDGPLWGQVNDYENADWWRRAGETVRRAGWRRFIALGRRRWLERRLLARQDLSLCNSEFTRQKILVEYRLPHPERVVTLHKAVDLEYFRRPTPCPADPLPRPASARRFVFVGSDIIRKGLDVLLQAMAMLPADFDWHLTVVGATRTEVAQAFPALPLATGAPRIVFAGTVEKEQLRKILWNSDVFVLPSRAEALGVALLEALAAGLPVVAAKVGGIPEIVQNPAMGILVPPDDAISLAQALQAVQPWPAGSPPEAVRKTLEYFSTHAMLARLRELYLRAV